MKVNEVFLSVQGEGPWTGKQCIFVRLAGCNLNCSWCDTKYAQYGLEVSVDSVIDTIELFGLLCRRVVVTGGEPTVQIIEMLELVNRLKEKGYTVAIETNGSCEFDPSVFDLVVVSPKSKEVLDHWYNASLVFTNVIIKWVIHPEVVEEQFEYLQDKQYHGVWLMPLGTSPLEVLEGMTVINEKIVEYGIDATVCNRLHVLLGCR